MLERILTTDVCSEIISLLVNRRGWTIPRIARVVGASSEYVRRIQSRKQSFQLSDLEALAKACHMKPHRLLFESMDREKMSAEQA